MAQTYEITDQGTDREALVFSGLEYRLDLTSDPRNSIGWVVTDERGVQDMCSVTEAAAVPGARQYVVERTTEGVQRAHRRATEFGYPAEPVEALAQELAEA